MYYQNHEWFDVPQSCRGVAASKETFDRLLDCAELRATFYDFVDLNCPASYDAACVASYQDNPPFSCSSIIEPSIPQIISNAFGNSQLIWSLWVVLLTTVLVKLFPNQDEDRQPRDVEGEAAQIVQKEKMPMRKIHPKTVHPLEVAMVPMTTPGPQTLVDRTNQHASLPLDEEAAVAW